MAITFKTLIPAKDTETVQTPQYTATTFRAAVDKMTTTNTGAATATLTVNLLPSGGTAGASNTIIKARQIAAGECYLCPEMVGQIVEVIGSISTLASAAGITIACAGREFS